MSRPSLTATAGAVRKATTRPHAHQGSTRPGLGVGLRIASGVFFTGMTLCVKLVSDTVPLGQIVFFRSAFAILPLVVFLMLRREFPGGLATKRPFGHLLRSGLGAASMFASFAAVARLPLADSTLVNYVTPLVTAMLGGVLLGEVLTRSRLTGIGLGMAGVLALTLPELVGAEVNATRLAGYGLGVLSSLLSAGAVIQIRRLGSTESPGAIAFYFVLVSALVSLPSLAAGWAAPSPGQFALLVLAGIMGGLAHISMTLAFRYAEVSLLAPFEYLTLLWAGSVDVFVLRSGLSGYFFVALPLLLAGAAVSTGRIGKRRAARAA